jgi:hypothetical protein
VDLRLGGGRWHRQLADILNGDVQIASGVQQEGADDNSDEAAQLSGHLPGRLCFLPNTTCNIMAWPGLASHCTCLHEERSLPPLLPD